MIYPVAAACGDLASTGHLTSAWYQSPIAAIMIATLAAVGTGVLLLVLSGWRLSIQAVMAIILLVGIGPLGDVAQSPQASEVMTCTNPTHSVIITQTATITGMAPSVAPQRITGTVTNTSKKSTELGTITASIGSVTMAPLAAPGRCDSSDYMLLYPMMPLNVAVLPGASVAFAGAMMGFRDKAWSNQDACKGAVIQLIYRLSPSEPCASPGYQSRIITIVNHHALVSENRSQLEQLTQSAMAPKPVCRSQGPRSTEAAGRYPSN